MRAVSKLFLAALSAACIAAAAPPASAPALAHDHPAHDYEAGTIVIDRPWSRATPPTARTAAGYMTLGNTGDAADRLLGGSSSAAARVEVHEMSMTDGIMRMRQLPEGLEIPPGGSAALEPGGHHLMLIDLKKPLAAGERVPVTLSFEKAGTVEVELVVQPLGAGAPEGGHRH